MKCSMICSRIIDGMGKRIILLAGVLLIISAILGLCFGTVYIGPLQLVRILQRGNESVIQYQILVHVRLPRVVGAILAGSALSVSGAVLQGVSANPLAGPHIIGINSGAGLCVLLISAFFPEMVWLKPVAAFTGGVLAAALALAISRINPSYISLILTGFMLGSIMTAGMNAVMLLYPDAYIGAGNFIVGSLSGLTLRALIFPAVYIAVALIGVMLLSRELNILELGDTIAMSLGIDMKRKSMLLVGLAAVLAGAAVSFGGLIGFVGLVVPHIVKSITKMDYYKIIPACAFLGAVFLVICDLLSRMMFAPLELPVGLFLSFIGGPAFICIYLLRRRYHD